MQYTYKDATRKVKKLSSKPHVFSTENDEHASKIANDIKKHYKLKTINKGKSCEEQFNAAISDLKMNSITKQNTYISNKEKKTTQHFGYSHNDEASYSKNDSFTACVDSDDSSVNNNITNKRRRMEHNTTDEIKTQEEIIKDKNIIENCNKNDGENHLEKIVLNCFRKLSAQISSVQAEVTRIKLDIADLKNQCSSSYSITPEIVNKQKILEENGLENLPFKSMNQFENFDMKLKNDPCVRKEIEEIVWSLVDINDKLSKTIKKIFVKFLAQNVILQFTVVKKTGDKKVFKDTNFYSCIRDTIDAEYRVKKEKELLKEKSMYDAIGHVINCAKDWYGGRREREKNQRMIYEIETNLSE